MKKLVREHINEKFSEKSDPIRDMNIGLFSHRDFKSYDEMYEWLYECMPAILNINNISKLLSQDPLVHINREYAGEFSDYITKYLTVEGERAKTYFAHFKIFIIRKMEKEKNKYVNEKFEENSDPVDDLGIGWMAKYLELKKGDALYGDNALYIIDNVRLSKNDLLIIDNYKFWPVPSHIESIKKRILDINIQLKKRDALHTYVMRSMTFTQDEKEKFKNYKIIKKSEL